MQGILLLIKLGFGSNVDMKKNIILCFLFLVFLIVLAGYIRLRFMYNQLKESQLNYIGLSAMKQEVMDIYKYLKYNNYIDQFGYLKLQFRFNPQKQSELLLILYDNNFFHITQVKTSEYVKFLPEEHFYCLQTLIVLCNLFKSYCELEPKEGCNLRKIHIMQHKLTMWVLSLPYGIRVGRENILKKRCLENLQITMPSHLHNSNNSR